jgi:cell pole-organizing protein PopZ
MNAPDSNSGERDLDALRRAQRAHEPSMEEILASIRSIIADDRETAPASPAPKPAAAPAGPQIVYSNDAPTPPPRAVSETPARVEPAPLEPVAPRVVWRMPGAEAVALASPPPAEAAAPEAPLVSAQTDRVVSAAFDALSASLALQSAELAENMTRELLRPMLKTWLDEHLPSLVERLVRAEIQRVARGGR